MIAITYPLLVRTDTGKLNKIKLTKELLYKGIKYIADKEKAQQAQPVVDLSDAALAAIMHSGMPISTHPTQSKAYKNNLKKMMPFFKKKHKLSTYRQVQNWALKYTDADARRPDLDKVLVGSGLKAYDMATTINTLARANRI